MPRTVEPQNPLVLIAASLLRVPARRMRALALGDDGALRDWIANESATRLAEARRDARLASARLEAIGARVIGLADPDYPPGLRDLSDPPAFLCVRGTLPARSFRTGTAVVGSRDADDDARAFARELASRLPGPIVSGLARGVDAAAHAGALDAGTSTLAYLGNGLGIAYPPENGTLQERIVAEGGALLSEFLPDESVTRWSLVRRDRLQAAHGANVLLVQSDADGGAMHTIAAANKLDRACFAMEPREGRADAGNRLAIEAGAIALPWNIPTTVRLLSAIGSGALRNDGEP